MSTSKKAIIIAAIIIVAVAAGIFVVRQRSRSTAQKPPAGSTENKIESTFSSTAPSSFPKELVLNATSSPAQYFDNTKSYGMMYVSGTPLPGAANSYISSLPKDWTVTAKDISPDRANIVLTNGKTQARAQVNMSPLPNGLTSININVAK